VNAALRLSPEGANLIKAFERCMMPVGGARYRAYLCPAGKLTIGWGHTNDHGRKFDARSIWTQAECDAAFDADMRHFEDTVHRQVTVGLAQHQFDALVSFAYNCGGANLSRSTLLRKVNAGDARGAAAEFARWNRANGRVLPGLVRRRASEALLFQGIPDQNYDGRPDPMQIASSSAVRDAIEAKRPPMPQIVDPE
jgi:lysozyme